MATEEEHEDDDYLKYINFAINTPKNNINKPESSCVVKEKINNNKINNNNNKCNYNNKNINKSKNKNDPIPRHGLKYFEIEDKERNKNKISTWTLDSGASYNVMYVIKSLTNFEEHEEVLTYADGRLYRI
jgi:hypothetical protein